ncbi:MAG: vWA domain-containing protein [Acidimicrobiales bacterium]
MNNNTPHEDNTGNNPTAGNGPTAPTHIVVLLDRSGSMAPIANDVIGGFNQYLEEQQKDGSDARISIVLFDSQNPQETVMWGAPISEAIALDRTSFVPRGGTPLLDATGLTIGRVMVDQQSRVAAGIPACDIVFVTVTDGEENQSHEFNLEQVRTLVNERTAEGWQFVYLSAGLEAYADAGRLGYATGASQAWGRTADSSRLMFHSLSKSTSNFRDKKRTGRDTATEDFFETGKDAEEDI